MKTIRIGSGAGYGGDRIEPAIDLIRKGNLDYIIFECLAERTIALAQDVYKRQTVSSPLSRTHCRRSNPLSPGISISVTMMSTLRLNKISLA